MTSNEIEGYRTFRATELPTAEQEKLRQVLRHELAVAMTRQIRESPPELDLSEIELILQPGQHIDEFAFGTAASCITCVTCITCDTCGTS